jgi:3-oxoadipate enol-lactonase
MMSIRAALVLLSLTLAGCAANAPPREGLMNIGDASLNYHMTGGAGTPIVFIHGWALNMDVWNDQVAAFSPAYRVIRYDLRGFGKSTGHADETADADDLRILLDSLGVSSAHLVGLSRGAGVASDFAVRWPDRAKSVVLYGFGPTPDFPLPPEMRDGPPFGPIARAHGLDSLKQWLAASPLAWEPPNRPDIKAKLEPIIAAYDGRDLLDARPPSGRVQPATLDEVSRLRIPTLVLHGDHDMPLLQAVADSLIAKRPAARRVVIKNAGHGAHLHQPDEFNREVLAFLAAVP